MNALQYSAGFIAHSLGVALLGDEHPDYIAGYYDAINDHLIP